MQTYVSRNLIHNNTLMKLPFYPHGAGHYTLKKGYTEHKNKNISPFVSVSWIEKAILRSLCMEKNIFYTGMMY